MMDTRTQLSDKPTTMLRGTTIAHASHELTWTAAGAATVEVHGASFRVDAHHALWLPSGIPHTLTPDDDAVVLPVFWSCVQRPLWSSPRLIARDELVDELARLLAHARLLDADTVVVARARLFDALPARETQLRTLALPSDPRARDVATALLADPSRHETLEEWGRAVHTSAKTLQRCFANETGLHFPQWRTRARLQLACTRLERGATVQQTAIDVGYASAGAFIEAFRRHLGVTPARYRATASTDSLSA